MSGFLICCRSISKAANDFLRSCEARTPACDGLPCESAWPVKCNQPVKCIRLAMVWLVPKELSAYLNLNRN